MQTSISVCSPWLDSLGPRSRAVLLALALLPASCSAPPTVRVVPRRELDLHRDLDACALHGDAPSARTSWLLRLTEAEESFRDDPLATLRTLSVRAQREQGRNRYFALAELSYLAAKRLGSRECCRAPPHPARAHPVRGRGGAGLSN